MPKAYTRMPIASTQLPITSTQMPMTSIRLASEFCPHRVVIGTLPTPRRFARTPTRYFRSRFSTRYFCPLSSAFFVLASSVFASCRGSRHDDGSKGVPNTNVVRLLVTGALLKCERPSAEEGHSALGRSHLRSALVTSNRTTFVFSAPLSDTIIISTDSKHLGC
eukprot:1195085-Prorocentrum_minimum.AAC.1